MRQGYQKSSMLLAGSEKGKTEVKNLRLIATKTGQRGNVNMQASCRTATYCFPRTTEVDAAHQQETGYGL